MIKFHRLKKTPKPWPCHFVCSVFKLDVRNIYCVYQNTSKLAILMPSHQINEKQCRWKKEYWSEKRGVRVRGCGSNTVLPLVQVPSLFRPQKKGGMGQNDLQGLSFRNKMTRFLNAPPFNIGPSFDIVEWVPTMGLCLLKCSDLNINPDWMGSME